MDLESAIELFFKDNWDFSDTTVTSYGYHFRHFKRYVGNPDIGEIESKRINSYLGHIVKRVGLSHRTASDHWIALSSLFSWAERELGIEHPMSGGKVPRPRFDNKKPDILNDDECKALLRCVAKTEYVRSNGTRVTARRATAIRDKAIILTLLDTGIRATELCELKIDDWSESRGRLHIKNGKGRHGGKERNVFVGKSCRSAILRYLIGRRNARPSEPLFASKTGGKIDRHNLRHMIGTVAKSAGVRQSGKGVYVHLLRHTFAVKFLRGGGNLRTLQEILGHEKLATVQHYLTLAETDLEQATAFSPADRMGLR